MFHDENTDNGERKRNASTDLLIEINFYVIPTHTFPTTTWSILHIFLVHCLQIIRFQLNRKDPIITRSHDFIKFLDTPYAISSRAPCVIDARSLVQIHLSILYMSTAQSHLVPKYSMRVSILSRTWNPRIKIRYVLCLESTGESM